MIKTSSDGICYNKGEVSLERIIAEAPFGLVTTDLEGNIILINKQFADLISIQENLDIALGRSIYQFVEHIPQLFEKVNQCIKITPVPFYLRSIPVHNRFLVVRGIPVDNKYLLVAHNITQVKEFEAAVLSAMIEGQDNERKKMAREIHDGFGPLLSAIRLNLEALTVKYNDQFDNQSREDITHIINALDETTKDIRALSHNLMPTVLIDFGLVPAVNNLCAKIRSSGKIDVEFITNLKRRIDPENELTIYRIVQELINNAIKHSEASRVNVQLMDHETIIILSVDDNGKGVNMKEIDVYSGGIGLNNIQARVNANRGSFTIESTPGNGFTAHVEIPLL